MYLVSIYFDEETNKILNRYIDKLAEKTGNTFMTEHNVPPHITISQIEARSENVLIPYMAQLRGKLKAGEISIVSVGMLLPYVLYAAPTLCEYLQDLANEVYNNFCDIPETIVSRYYNPASWLPHITLGKKLSKEQLLTAVSIMQTDFAPIKAKVVEIGLAKVNPHEDVVRFELL